MKRISLRTLLFVLAALLLIAGLVVLPVVRDLRQEAKDRALIAAIERNDGPAVVHLLDERANANARDLPGIRVLFGACAGTYCVAGRHPKTPQLSRHFK